MNEIQKINEQINATRIKLFDLCQQRRGCLVPDDHSKAYCAVCGCAKVNYSITDICQECKTRMSGVAQEF